MEEQLNEIESAADKVLSPERGLRWGVRLLILVIVVASVVTVGKVAITFTSKVTTKVEDMATTSTLTRAWFVAQLDSIQAARLEEVAAREALERHQQEAAGRTFSRESDRQESSRLNQAILEVQRRRLRLSQDYNASLQQIPDRKVVEGLPERVELDR